MGCSGGGVHVRFGIGVGVAVGPGVGVGEGMGVAVGSGAGVGDGVGVAVGSGVGVGNGVGDGVTVAVGDGAGVGDGIGAGEGAAVGAEVGIGNGVGVTVAVGDGLGVGAGVVVGKCVGVDNGVGVGGGVGRDMGPVVAVGTGFGVNVAGGSPSQADRMAAATRQSRTAHAVRPASLRTVISAPKADAALVHPFIHPNPAKAYHINMSAEAPPPCPSGTSIPIAPIAALRKDTPHVVRSIAPLFSAPPPRARLGYNSRTFRLRTIRQAEVFPPCPLPCRSRASTSST